MQKAAPRLLIAGTNSGCGKTTVTCAILQALVDGGVSVAAAKCGPDYIDPMFHREIIGAKSSNLDPFFFGRRHAALPPRAKRRREGRDGHRGRDGLLRRHRP